jgi:hypothetical protein
VLKQPAAPSMLGEGATSRQQPRPDERSKRGSGEALAAALASAGTGPNGSSAEQCRGVRAQRAACRRAKPWPPRSGFPSSTNGRTRPGPARRSYRCRLCCQAAPRRCAPTSRQSRSSVPPQVKVATVEAKHTEAKQPAELADDKPPAQIVDDGKTTLVDAKPQYIDVPVREACRSEARRRAAARSAGRGHEAGAPGVAVGSDAQATAIAVRRQQARQGPAPGSRGVAWTGPERLQGRARRLGLGHRQAHRESRPKATRPTTTTTISTSRIRERCS